MFLKKVVDFLKPKKAPGLIRAAVKMVIGYTTIYIAKAVSTLLGEDNTIPYHQRSISPSDALTRMGQTIFIDGLIDGAKQLLYLAYYQYKTLMQRGTVRDTRLSLEDINRRLIDKNLRKKTKNTPDYLTLKQLAEKKEILEKQWETLNQESLTKDSLQLMIKVSSYFKFFFETISIFFLLKTLVDPFKFITDYFKDPVSLMHQDLFKSDFNDYEKGLYNSTVPLTVKFLNYFFSSRIFSIFIIRKLVYTLTNMLRSRKETFKREEFPAGGILYGYLYALSNLASLYKFDKRKIIAQKIYSFLVEHKNSPKYIETTVQSVLHFHRKGLKLFDDIEKVKEYALAEGTKAMLDWEERLYQIANTEVYSSIAASFAVLYGYRKFYLHFINFLENYLEIIEQRNLKQELMRARLTTTAISLNQKRLQTLSQELQTLKSLSDPGLEVGIVPALTFQSQEPRGTHVTYRRDALILSGNQPSLVPNLDNTTVLQNNSAAGQNPRPNPGPGTSQGPGTNDVGAKPKPKRWRATSDNSDSTASKHSQHERLNESKKAKEAKNAADCAEFLKRKTEILSHYPALDEKSKDTLKTILKGSTKEILKLTENEINTMAQKLELKVTMGEKVIITLYKDIICSYHFNHTSDRAGLANFKFVREFRDGFNKIGITDTTINTLDQLIIAAKRGQIEDSNPEMAGCFNSLNAFLGPIQAALMERRPARF